MNSLIKSWETKKFRLITTLDFFNDFTVQLTNQYSVRKMSTGDLLNEWFGFEENKANEISIIIEMLALIPVEKMDKSCLRIGKFYAAYPDAQNWNNDELRPDQMFFYGPRKHSLSLDERQQIKRDICEKLNHVYKPEDGFILFDYSEISYTREVSNDSGGEDYFKIQNGKVIYGGFDHTGNGGEQSWDLESVYYWPESLFNLLTNQRFSKTQKEVKEIMGKYIVRD